MTVFPGWTINGQPISVQIILSDDLYDRAIASVPSDINLYNVSVTRSTYTAAYNYMFTTIVPAFGVALANNGLPATFSRPVIAEGHTEVSQGFGLVRPQLISGTGYQQIKAPTGNNGPKIKSNWWSTLWVQTTPDPNGVIYPRVSSTVGKTVGSSEPEMDESCSVLILPERAFTDGIYNGETCKAVEVSISLGLHKLSATSYSAEGWIRLGGTSTDITSTITNLIGGIKAVDETDPYSQGDESESIGPAGSSFTGIGGQGSFTNPQFTGGVPSLPTLSAVDTGLLQLYCSSSAAGMNALAQFLWSSAFDLDTFKKLFTDPMDLIIGAAILPCTPSNAASVILFGNINTGVSMPKATTQYVAVDCGTLTLTPRTGSFLDYAPHSKISIYLPYIGMRELNMTELVGKTIGVVYHVDVLTGACVAFVTANGVVLYEYSGSCAVQIPITSSNWASVLQSLATIGGSAIGGFAAGGPMGAVVAGGVSAASNAASGGLTPSFQRGGSVSGSAGLLADQNPYLVVELPNQCKASNQNWFEGYPNYTTMYLNQCVGYTKVHEINLEGIGCTRSELAEIETLLKGGVII